MHDLYIRSLFTWRSAVASEHGPENPTTRHVLLTLSLHMNERGESCWPSIELLVIETALSRRSVLDHLKTAASGGWIGKRDQRKPNSQGWRRVEYFAVIPADVAQAFHEKQGGAVGAPPSEPVERGAAGAPPQRGARSSKRGATDGMNVVQEVHPSTSVNSSITLQGGRGARRPRPGEDYTPSPEIVEWVKARGHGAYLELHVEKFRNACATQRRKAYDDIDSAFRNCVLDDWGRVRFQAQMAARRGDGPAAPTQAKKWPKCRYCPRESSATHDGIPHCGADACSSRALDREPAPA